MSPRPLSILLALLLLTACREPSGPAKAAPPPAAVAPTGRGVLPEKLGLRFLPAETEDGGRAWLASSPIRCAAGEHDLVRCLTITPLATDPRLNPGDGGITPWGVVAANGETAHRLCAQRFGGRLPTPAERAGLGALHGLSSLLVVQTSSPAERFRYLELPEWTEEGTCDNPVSPGEGCRLSLFPSGAAAESMRSGELSCTARPVADTAGFSVIELGEACPREQGLALDAGPETLPCLLRLHGPTAAAAPPLYSLSCSAFVTVRPEAALELRAGAYRCLVPPMAFGQAPTAR